MYYGLTISWDTDKNSLKLLSGNPIYEKSVAVHRLTLLSSIPVSNIVEATFSSYDAEKEEYQIITSAIPMQQTNIDEYQCGIPDLVLETKGTYIVSFAEKTPVIVNGETKYQFLTTGNIQFYVGDSGARAIQDPLPQTIADRLQEEINLLSERVTQLENMNVRKVLVDFTVNPTTGEGKKYYSDGSTATVQFPTGGGGSSEIKNWLKILTFDAGAWVNGEIAFGAMQTGFNSADYMVYLEAAGTEIYEAGTELTPTEKNGWHRLSDTVFKGTDGSLLISSNVPYSGRLLLMGNGAASGNFITKVSFEGSVMTVTYADGTTEDFQLPYLTDGEASVKYQTKANAEQFEEQIRGYLTWKIIK